MAAPNRNSLINVTSMFKVFQASWVLTVDSFFKKFPQTEVRWREVWRSWCPKATTENAIIEEDTVVPQFVFETLRTWTNAEDFHVVQHSISSVLNINVSTEVELCFVRK
jgi:hypothetical protein